MDIIKEDPPKVKRKRRELKGLIKRYLDSIFGEYLTEFKLLDYENMSLAKLEETLEDKITQLIAMKATLLVARVSR
jgi:hypothetical protein